LVSISRPTATKAEQLFGDFKAPIFASFNGALVPGKSGPEHVHQLLVESLTSFANQLVEVHKALDQMLYGEFGL